MGQLKRRRPAHLLRPDQMLTTLSGLRLHALLQHGGIWLAVPPELGEVLNQCCTGQLDGGPGTAEEVAAVLAPLVGEPLWPPPGLAAPVAAAAEAAVAEEAAAAATPQAPADVSGARPQQQQQQQQQEPEAMEVDAGAGMGAGAAAAADAAAAAEAQGAAMDTTEGKAEGAAEGEADGDEARGGAAASMSAGEAPAADGSAAGAGPGPGTGTEGATAVATAASGQAGTATAAAAGQAAPVQVRPGARERRRRGGGTPAPPPPPFAPAANGCRLVAVRLTLEEAFFLHRVLRCLQVYELQPGAPIPATSEHVQLLDEQGLWDACRAIRSNFVTSYAAYHHLKAKGWIPRSGLLYGVDYVVYQLHPVGAHSDFGVLVIPLGPGGEQEGPGAGPHTPPMRWLDLQITNRLINQVVKKLILLYLYEQQQPQQPGGQQQPGGPDHATPACLQNFLVEERIVRRWVPDATRD
ncbi:hypothetical protein CHLRE_02g096900v5 [Chlamydomonas reinhardtii]|uniref:tRNA-intron lyase n=1 Tax=Chlamydomonas reinhardtii TaxID=3055 RepID=A0A2K3E1Z7_CHLRE|nr:uncharacterized protein CHLRE_02g096900v5 [Chlamydomonas reinhardtii]PNW86818.1 hypothetical protein CHLRE_02g096900v5 [Chlamydomonas reinhardtii]